MEKILDKKDLKNILILFPISIFAFFSNIWVRTADLMEARNFITAKEMIENDNFIVPTLNGFLRFEKPPLPTWFTAFVMKATGNFTDEWVLRIPAALTGITFIFLLYYFVKILTKDSKKSFITAFVGTTTFMLIKIGNENAWDIYPYVFAFGCITFLVKGFSTEKIKDFFISGIFLAASFMSKGPVGIYGLILPFFISYGFIFGVKNYKKNFKKIIFMILIGITLGSIWSISVYTKYPEIFLSVMKKEESTWTSAFNLITHVIYETTPYYKYKELASEQKRLMPQKDRAWGYESLKVKRLLFRLVNYAQPATIVDAGMQAASSLYLKAAKEGADYTAAADLSELFLESGASVDFLYLHDYRRPEFVEEVFRICADRTAQTSVFVIEGIRYTSRMRAVWRRISRHEKAGITFDLYDLGIIFFDKTRIKQDYIVNF